MGGWVKLRYTCTADIQCIGLVVWIPAFAGMTGEGCWMSKASRSTPFVDSGRATRI